MKIALVIEKFDPSGGGNERSTDQIARRLIQRGHEVTVLTGSVGGASPEAMEGGRIELRKGFLGTRSALGLWRFADWAQRRIDAGGFDVSLSMTTAVPAHVVQPRGGTVRETLLRNIAMRPSEPRRKLKVLSLALSPKPLALLACESRTFNHPRVRRVVAISRYVADQLFHHYALSSRIVREIPNAAEVPAMNPVDRQVLRARTRRALRLDDGDVAFLFAALNPALKGLDRLLPAMAGVYAACPRARLVVAGTLDYRYVRTIDRLGIPGAVRFIGPTREMDALYCAADATVLPTWYDPSSKVVLESLLHGTPAISTLYNGASQWILDPTGRRVIRSPFEAGDAPPPPAGDAPRAGRVVACPSRHDDLIRAMLDLCDDGERERCAAATIGLRPHIGMDRHVERLEEVLREASEG